MITRVIVLHISDGFFNVGWSLHTRRSIRNMHGQVTVHNPPKAVMFHLLSCMKECKVLYAYQKMHGQTTVHNSLAAIQDRAAIFQFIIS